MRWRSVCNWINLSTPAGLGVARLGRCGVRRGPEHLWLAEDYRLGFPIAGAFTVGNVVITPHTFDVLLKQNPNLLRHEAAHATQWAILGPLFLPLYTGAMAWSWLRSGDRASHNVFETAAGLEHGGYRRSATRDLASAASSLMDRWRKTSPATSDGLP